MKLNNERPTISEKIYHISTLQQDYINNELKEINLNSQQARSLCFIKRNPNTIQKALAKYLGKSDATITNILKALEKKGLINRVTPEDNERQKEISLSKEGEDLVLVVADIFKRLNEKINEAISDEDRNDIIEELEKIENIF